jgi:hypothetical protein
LDRLDASCRIAQRIDRAAFVRSTAAVMSTTAESVESNEPAAVRPAQSRHVGKSKSKAKAKAKAKAKVAALKSARHKLEARASAERNAQDPTPPFETDEFELDASDSDADEETDAARSFPDRLEADYLNWSDEQRAELIESIVCELRRHCAREGTSPGDATSLYVPTGSASVRHGTDEKSWFSGSNAVTAFFLDSFLYSHEDMQRMIDRGTVEIFYCQRCERTVQGDCRRKNDTQRSTEENARRKQIAEMKLRHRMARRERRQLRAEADTSSASVYLAPTADAAPAVPSTSAADTSSSKPSLFASALSTITNSFSFLSAGECDDTEQQQTDDDHAAEDDTPSEADLAADAVLAAEIAALPPISPYRFPRHDLQPKLCCYCHATCAHIAVRTHLTHSLSVKQMTDMYQRLIRPHIDFAQPIGHVTKRAKSAAAAAVDDAVYSLDIGSRLGNMLYMGLLHTSCPRWVGVELDSFFVSQSRRIVRKWQMQAHVRIVEDDIAKHGDLLAKAKLVCFFNSFELHVTREKHRELLQFLADSISTENQYILSCPSLLDIYTRAESEVNVPAWVELIAEQDDAYLYRVR